jgi:phage-related protein
MARPGWLPSWAQQAAEYVQGLLNRTPSIPGSVWSTIDSLRRSVEESIHSIQGWVIDQVWKPLSGFLSKVFQSIPSPVDSIRPIRTAVVNALNRVWFHARVGFDMVTTRIDDVWREISGAIRPAVNAVQNQLSDLAREVFRTIPNRISGLWSEIVRTASKLDDLIRGFDGLVAGAVVRVFYSIADPIGDILDRYIDDHWED